MAGRLHFAEGFDYGSNDEGEFMDYYRRFSGTPSPGTSIFILSAGGHITNEGYLQIGGGRKFTMFAGAIPVTGADIIFGVCVGGRIPSQVGTLMTLNFNEVEEINLAIDSSGFIAVKRGATVLGTSTIALNTNDGFHYITLKVNLHNTTGSFSLYIDHVLGASGSGLDTSSGGALKIDGCEFEDEFLQWDHVLVINDAGAVPTNDWIVQNLNVDGDGNYSQFAPSSGANYTNVDDAAMNHDTDYNEDGVVAQRDSYTHANPVEAITGTIEGIIISHWIRQVGPGTRTVEPFIRQASTDHDLPVYTPDNASDYRMEMIFVQDSPGGATNFTPTEIDNLETGIRITT